MTDVEVLTATEALEEAHRQARAALQVAQADTARIAAAYAIVMSAKAELRERRRAARLARKIRAATESVTR